jgi:hypothetical protein
MPEEDSGVRVVLLVPLIDGLCMSCRSFLLPFTGQYHARSQPEDKPSADGERNVRQHVIITPNLGLAYDLRIRSRLTLTQFYNIRGTLDTAKCTSTYLLTMLSALVTSTLLAALANAASIAKRENDGNFFSDLSLRTVGARNTLVSHPSIKFGLMSDIYRTGGSGSRRLETPSRSGMTYPSTLTKATSESSTLS